MHDGNDHTLVPTTLTQVNPFGFSPPAPPRDGKQLGLGSTTGSLTPRKRADLILVRTTDHNIAPISDPDLPVQPAQPVNVDTVMANGLKTRAKL